MKASYKLCKGPIPSAKLDVVVRLCAYSYILISDSTKGELRENATRQRQNNTHSILTRLHVNWLKSDNNRV